MIWMQTLGGGFLDLCNPAAAQISFSHVATVLSRTARFGGHTEHGTYSVAQHCEQGARAILRDTGRRDWAAAFLLHDAHEAYLGDMTTPIAEALAACSEWPAAVRSAIAVLKARLDAAIYGAAGVTYPLPVATQQVVKKYDLRMMRTERDERLAPPPFPWGTVVEAAEPIAGCDLWPWSEGTTAALWLAAFEEMC